MTKRGFLKSGWGGLALLLAGLLLAACGDNTASSGVTGVAQATAANASIATSSKDQPPVKVAVGYTAPDFSVKDINGQTLQLSAFRGKGVLLNFWAVNCEPCREEAPTLTQAYNSHKANFSIIGINWNDDPKDVKDYINQFKVAFPVTIDGTGDLVTQFHARGQPTNIFIDQNGVISSIVVGMVTPQTLDQQLPKLTK